MIGILLRWLPLSLALHAAALAATLLLPGESALAPLFVDLTLAPEAPAPPPTNRAGGDAAPDRAPGPRAAPGSLSSARAGASAGSIPAAPRPAAARPAAPAADAVPPPPAETPPATAPSAAPQPVPPPAPAPAMISPAETPPPAPSPVAVAPPPTRGSAAPSTAPAGAESSAPAWTAFGAGRGDDAPQAGWGLGGRAGGGGGAVAGDGSASGGGAGGEGALALAVPGDGGGAYAAYLALLRRRVQEALTYPPAARRRSLGGTVHIEITVEPSGRISGVDLARSSSHDVLDAAALDAVRGLGRVPFPSDVKPRALRVRLPVTFELR